MDKKYIITTFLIVFGLTIVFSILTILLIKFIHAFIFEGPMAPFEYVYDELSHSIQDTLAFISIFSLTFSIVVTALGIKWYSKRWEIR